MSETIIRPGVGVRLELPLPPSANRYWRTRVQTRKGTGKPFVMTYLSAEAKAFRATVKSSFWSAAYEQSAETDFVPRDNRRLAIYWDPLTGRLAVDIQVFPKSKARDIDNAVKPILDALEYAGVFEDDNQVDDLHVTREKRVKGGKVIVGVREI